MPETPEFSPDLSSLSYEDAREALDEVVRRLESGGVSLEEALELWERGEQLAKLCEAWLEGAKARLQAADPDSDTDNDNDNDNDDL